MRGALSTLVCKEDYAVVKSPSPSPESIASTVVDRQLEGGYPFTSDREQPCRGRMQSQCVIRHGEVLQKGGGVLACQSARR